MSGVGFAGSGLAEVFVMRKMHKEKMKKMVKENADDQTTCPKVADDEKKIPGGCFFRLSKKSHSAKVSSAECDRKLQVEGKWDSKS